MCGICGAVAHRDPIRLEMIVKQLTLVNHRGHEAVGIAVVSGRSEATLPAFIDTGLVREACNANRPLFREFSEHVLAMRPAAFIGHTRYSTMGPSNVAHGQPIKMHHPAFGDFFLAHNGQIPNHRQIRRRLEEAGQRFATESDSETLAALIAHSPLPTLPGAVAHMMKEVKGAFSLLVLGQHHFVAARDRHGIWPLWYGVAENGDYLFSSEEGALGAVKCTHKVQPGSMASIPVGLASGLKLEPVVLPDPKKCWLDVAYLTRPDDGFGGATVAQARFELGQQLARDCPVEADVVTGVPDSGIDAAQGFASESGIPLRLRAMVRNRFAPGRSFILPGQSGRQDAVRDKQSVTRREVAGKRVVVVDDTIVRSNTARIITQMMRAAGASEVHWRIAAPPIKHPCFYGIDMPTREDLPAATKSCEEIARGIEANSLCYLPLPSMLKALNTFQKGWCTACVTGEYPIPIE